jgi:putative ATP-dependent endonuclease of OLD family
MDRQTLDAYDHDAAAFANEWETQPPPIDMYDLIRQYFDPGLTADIGCGSGRDTNWLSKNGYTAIGFDASEGLLAAARRLHGLQRAVILTVLRFMADHRAKQEGTGQEFSEPQSDLIVAIEEPEIYQHPTKQRLFGKLLRTLAQGFNAHTGIRIQTIFVTHSPLLVSLSECQSIRMVRVEGVPGKRNVLVRQISLAECSAHSAAVSGQKPEEAWSAAQFAAKLHNFNAEIAEGFFAKCVVLVEGVGDKTIVEAWYRHNGRDPHAEGIVIVDVTGKHNLTRPIIVFEKAGVPCYWIFDNDQSGNPKNKPQNIATNKTLQRLAGISAEAAIDWPDGQHERFTSWSNKLEDFVRTKVGPADFEKMSASLGKEFDIDPNMCLKFPATAAEILRSGCAAGAKCPELDNIVSAVDKLIAD